MKSALIVDDIKGIQTLLAKCLALEGYEASACGDGESALELLLRERFDLVFLDIRLPLLSGTEVLRRMRRADIRTPVVIMTAHGNIRNAVDCTRLGAAVYLQKPFTLNRVLGVLQELGMHGERQESRVVREAEALCEQHRYEETERFLKGMAGTDLLNPEIYRMLAEASRKQNRPEEAEQFRKLYEAIKKNG